MQPLCHIDDIPEGESRGFTVEDLGIVAVNFRGEYYLYENNCPHRSIPLEWQPDQFLDYDKNFIQCATHGALFKIDSGECIAGPCVGDQLKAIDFQIKEQQIYVELDKLT